MLRLTRTLNMLDKYSVIELYLQPSDIYVMYINVIKI